MLLNDLEKIGSGFFAGKQFTLAEYNVLLQVISRLFGNTEVFHLGRHFDLSLLANAEEMVYGITTGKNNGRVIQKVDLIFSEFFKGNRIYLNKFPEIYLDTVFFGNGKVRRIIVGRFWLRNENALYFLCVLIRSQLFFTLSHVFYWVKLIGNSGHCSATVARPIS